MGRVATAFRAFFKVLGDAALAEKVDGLLEGKLLEGQAPAAVPVPAASKAAVRAPGRSEAVTLLEVLQRESRLVDFLKESVDAYSDAQIGAAVRDVHRDAAAALERMFALRPVAGQAEGVTLDVPTGADAGRYRVVGNVTGTGPYRGTLRHAGWQATKVELPEWQGTEATARVVAPAEVEV